MRIILASSSLRRVEMKPMLQEDIEAYIRTKEPLDKAGSYAVQGEGSKYIEKIEGNRNIAVGMYTEKLEELLNKYNLRA